MFLLILESLGSTELFFILVMALVFFGPRKLPQLSRTLGKSLADFRRASEDFKRTWDKEVSLEETGVGVNANEFSIREQNSIPATETTQPSLQPPAIGAIAPERVIARDTLDAESTETGNTAPGPDGTDSETKPSPKSEWL